jgi:hypothetical protein
VQGLRAEEIELSWPVWQPHPIADEGGGAVLGGEGGEVIGCE